MFIRPPRSRRHDTALLTQPVDRFYRLALVAFLAGIAALWFDLALLRGMHELRWHTFGDLQKTLMLWELFGHGAGTLLILVAMAVLDLTNRHRVWRIAASTYGAGLVAYAIKSMVMRHRPQNYFNDDTLMTAVWPTSFYQTFIGLTPWVDNPIKENLHHSIVQSFPSGHTTAAVALAAGLSLTYPHGKWLFFTLATLTAVERVAVRAHFLSDVLIGAAVGMVVAALVHDPRLAWRKAAKTQAAVNPIAACSSQQPAVN